MRSKYKVGLFRANLVLGAALLAYQAAVATRITDATLLGLAAAWLAITATVLEFSHRHHAFRPWLLVPSVLLAALVTLSADLRGEWLWAWPCLLILPQHQWMLALNLGLAAFSWWWTLDYLDPHHWVLSGAILAGLSLIAVARATPVRQAQRGVKLRARLAPGLPLWPLPQLERDLPRESSRAMRDGVHAELVLIQTSGRQLWSLARQLCSCIQYFENVYRLDGRTLALMLTSRDALQADMRRTALLDGLGTPVTVRAIALPHLESLAQAMDALDKQCPSTRVIEEMPHD